MISGKECGTDKWSPGKCSDLKCDLGSGEWRARKAIGIKLEWEASRMLRPRVNWYITISREPWRAVSRS